MTTLAVPLLILLGLPLLILIFFKTNAGVMFLAACSGLVLLSSLDPTVVITAGAIVPGVGEAYVRLSIVMLSILFAAMMFRGTTQGSKIFLNILIVIFLSGTLWLVLPRATGVSWLIDSTKESIWKSLDDFKSLIIATGFALSLLAVLVRGGKQGRKTSH